MSQNLRLPTTCIRSTLDQGASPSDVAGNLLPHVYTLACHIVELSGAELVINLGGYSQMLACVPVGTRVRTFGFNTGETLAVEKPRSIDFQFEQFDFNRGLPVFTDAELANAVVICTNVIECVREPERLLRGLAHIASACRYLLISTPARDRTQGAVSPGSSAGPFHCQEWTLSEFVVLARSFGLRLPFYGYTSNSAFHGWKTSVLAIDGRESNLPLPTKTGAEPCAIVKAYNDEDFIEHSIGHLRQQGLRVHLIDNWSTDRTYSLSQELAANDAGITVERFPDAPINEYAWKSLLEHTVCTSERLGHGWYVHIDSDELRDAPWPGATLADAIRYVDMLGYTAIDFTVIDFRYLRDEAYEGKPWESMRFFEFGRRHGHFRQIKAWKYTGQSVDLASSGGHEAIFEGRRVYPLKFMLRHFPLRGPEHARRKIFQERLSRTRTEREQFGWHIQYDTVDEERLKGWRRHELLPWHPLTFEVEYLVERLSGIGLLD